MKTVPSVNTVNLSRRIQVTEGTDLRKHKVSKKAMRAFFLQSITYTNGGPYKSIPTSMHHTYMYVDNVIC